MKIKSLLKEENIKTINLIDKTTFELIEMLIDNPETFPFIDTSDILTVSEEELAITSYDLKTRRIVVLIKKMFDIDKIEDLNRTLVEYVVGEELPYLEDVFNPNVNPRKLKGQGITEEGIFRLKVISYLFKSFKSPDINNKILNEKRNKSIENQSLDNNINPLNIYKKFKVLKSSENEELYILCFNRKKQFEKLLRYTNDHPNTAGLKRETVKEIAKNKNWQAFLFVHNHPNGESVPSKADVDFTKTVSKVISEENKIVLDHVIIGNDNYFSFYENN